MRAQPALRIASVRTPNYVIKRRKKRLTGRILAHYDLEELVIAATHCIGDVPNISERLSHKSSFKSLKSRTGAFSQLNKLKELQLNKPLLRAAASEIRAHMNHLGISLIDLTEPCR